MKHYTYLYGLIEGTRYRLKWFITTVALLFYNENLLYIRHHGIRIKIQE